jgi:hypothetical protein
MSKKEMRNLQAREKKQRAKTYTFRYSEELEGMVLEIFDEGMFPLFMRMPEIPSIGTRKIILINKKGGSRGLQMT